MMSVDDEMDAEERAVRVWRCGHLVASRTWYVDPFGVYVHIQLPWGFWAVEAFMLDWLLRGRV